MLHLDAANPVAAPDPLTTVATALRATPTPPVPDPASVLPKLDAECTTDWCEFVLQQTGSRWFAAWSDLLLVKPLRIVLIIALAMILRRLACRTINRLIRTTSNGQVPAVLRPLRERVVDPPPPDAIPERRRQRAEAIGSVLRSLATAVIYTIALLMVLRELGFDLAPLLASAGIVGVAIGFGAQTLVKDLIAGLFMLLEDQYGVGDYVDLGEASGTIEAVGLRITTLRDSQGATWYIRNGAITRVANRSQGWAVVIVDVPVKLPDIERATAVLRQAAADLGSDPDWTGDLVEPPAILGVEQITADGAVLRGQARSRAEAQWRVGREMRSRFTEALAVAHVDQAAGAGPMEVATIPAAPDRSGATDAPGDDRPNGPDPVDTQKDH